MKHSLIQEIDLETGTVVSETHRLDGQRHRDPREGPAYIYRSINTGLAIREYYYWHGRLHRSDGPARVEYNADATAMTSEMYYRHGLLHRDPKQGPARIERNNMGTVVITESYYVNGWPYRDPADGPWHIARFDDGRMEHELYSQPSEVPRPGRASRKRSGPVPAP